MADARSCLNMTLGEIAQACGGACVGDCAAVTVRGLSTDSRDLRPGELFVALKGDRHDGHQFVAQAFADGAAAAVVSDAAAVPAGRPAVLVKDTLAALGQIAAAHRARCQVRIAAITGSVAKTTTKDMLTSIMRGVGPTLSAEGTRNNEIGVPLTLLALCAEHRFCVVELAMRGAGEIAYLAAMVRPQVGVITNIGESHVGRLGSRDAIARAKAELLEFLPPDGCAVLHADDFYFALLTELAPCPVLSFGQAANAAVHPEQVVTHGLAGSEFLLATPSGRVPVRLQVPGRHNITNALGAAAAALGLGADLEQIATGLGAYAGTPMRLQRVAGVGGCVLINDAYNASPDSVRAALELLAETEGRRIMVFGDMLELGTHAQEAHREVGRQAARAQVAYLLSVGPMAALAAEEAGAAGVRVSTFDDALQAAAALRPELQPGDVVLIKGSRGMTLERVVEALRDD